MESVVNLNIIKTVTNFKQPYKDFQTLDITGSGFVISREGLIVTNAELVKDSVSIIANKKFSLEVVGICREKDLAICKFVDKIKVKPLIFADSMNITLAEQVFSLGKTISKGIISGYKKFESTKEDSLTRGPNYISTDIHISEENNGGPLLNKNNEVIGINKIINGINYAIPSRTFLALYSELLKGDIKMPSLSLDWCKTNREIMKKQTGNSSTYGIYVRKVYPDSCLDSLEKGDIIRRIDYTDLCWKSDGSSNVNLENIGKQKTLVTVFLDRFGMTNKIVKLKDPDELDETKIEFETVFTEKVLSLSEVMDMVPINSNLILNICRNQQWYKLKTEYIVMSSERLTWESSGYEILAGLCVANLTRDYLNIFNIEDEYRKSVIITEVFPTHKVDILKPGQIIKSLLGYNSDFVLIESTHKIISNLNDIREIINLDPEYLQITTTDNSTYLFSYKTILEEDKIIKIKYKIKE